MNPISSNLNTQIALGQLQIGHVAKSGPKVEADADNPGSVLNSFGDMLKKQMEYINQTQQNADNAAETYALGGDIELHNVIIATEKAEMTLQFASQVRNKIVNAYQEISRMPI